MYVGGATDAQYRATKGRIASYGPSANGQVRVLAEDLIKSGALKGKTVAIASTDLPDQVDVVQESLLGPLKKAGVKVVTYDVLPCQGNILCTQPIPQSVMKVAATKPDVVIPVMTATTLPVYVNEMQKAGMKAQGLRDVVQRARHRPRAEQGAAGRRRRSGEVLRRRDARVGAPSPATGACPGFAPPPIGTMCNDVYAKNTKTGRLVRARHRGLHEVGHGRLVVHEHAHGGPRDVRRRTEAHAADVRRTRCASCPPDPIGGIGGAPVVVYIDGKTTPTTAFESAATYPCKLPAPPEDTICLIPKSTKPRTIAP